MSFTCASRHRLLTIMITALLAGLAAVCSTTVAQAGPAITSTGHHAVHDVHCEPAQPSDSTTARLQLPDEPTPLDTAVDISDGSGPSAPCHLVERTGAPSTGRATLLAIGVDRN